MAGKPLPFRTKIPYAKTSDYDVIRKVIKQGTRKAYVIDDSQYLMAFFMFNHVNETGYGKFTKCAVDFRNLIDFIVNETPDDTIVYLLHHIDKDEQGFIKAKTQGKMLDNQLTLEGLFTIVLLCETDGKKHWFTTQSNGLTPAKSPMEMFPDKIDNDLKAVDSTVRDYYNLARNESQLSGVAAKLKEEK
ncbi:conserved hypothetical protein [Acidaminococcus intestini RyC-MR95]|uniref:Uncharacterized protein n=1 Tax=Acidaminococcus intestini (strain RyC-MR95) TaxID=568816 RepID=G4Q3Z7_ACIIR|nr:conserved hypothetical protein [Acidaminococcus intestini RyC-MR95]